ncbi:hypothetical protein EDB19DRAFT_1740653, partial [Suillus lakei]
MDDLSSTIVRDFIDRRRKIPELKDQIHAIWLCLSIPLANGRLLESGIEEFLKSRKEILGNSAQRLQFVFHNSYAIESDDDEAALEVLKIDIWITEVAEGDILHTTSLISHFCCSTASARKVSLATVFNAMLTCGFLGYWRGLASSMNFTGFTMWDALSVIHKDIVDVWNFNDPHC